MTGAEPGVLENRTATPNTNPTHTAVANAEMSPAKNPRENTSGSTNGVGVDRDRSSAGAESGTTKVFHAGLATGDPTER